MAMSRSLGGRSLTTRSPMAISPAVISSSPATMRSVVVLPQPDGPTSTMNSLSRIVRRSEEHTSELQSRLHLHSFPTRRSSDLPGRDLFEPGDHAERRGLAAARWPDEHHELLVTDRQVDVLDRVHFVVFLVQVLQHDLSHGRPLSFLGVGHPCRRPRPPRGDTSTTGRPLGIRSPVYPLTDPV